MHLSFERDWPASTAIRRRLSVVVLMLAIGCAAPAWAQKVTTVDGLTLEQTFSQLTDPLSGRPTGQAIGLATALEIATSPFGTSSGGFVFKLDPSTGLLARTTTTFGPSFTERAQTSGEGQVSMGATFSSTTYDKLSGLDLSRLPVGSITGGAASSARTGTANFALSSKTVALSGTVGVTKNFDIGVVVPLVTIKFTGTSSLVRGDGIVPRLAETTGIFSGIGDVAAIAKYRLFTFKGPELPDPGGVALLVNMRLPTGDRANLRGLGVTRTLVSGVVSAGKGRVRPHGNAGFELWSKGVDVPSMGGVVSVRHQIQYAAGVEIEAAPKVTLNVDFLGQQIRGGGQVGSVADTPVPAGATSIQSLVALSNGIRKALLVPGVKVNLKGKLLLSLNAIVTMKNNGLHSTVTPVVGLNLTM